MKKLSILIAAAALAAAAVACGGGTSSSDKTATAAAGAKPTSAATVKTSPTSAATTAATKAPSKTAESPTESAEATTTTGTPSKAELAQDVTTLKGIMQQIITKAQAGDVQGTRDTEATMDTAIEAVVKATRAVDPALADSIEKLELDIEAQADASTTDLAIIAKDAQAIPALLDQVVTTLKLQ
jgi:ABC-type transport system substrate-binding protein